MVAVDFLEAIRTGPVNGLAEAANSTANRRNWIAADPTGQASLMRDSMVARQAEECGLKRSVVLVDYGQKTDAAAAVAEHSEMRPVQARCAA